MSFLSIQLDPALKARLDRLAAEKHRSADWLMSEAIRDFAQKKVFKSLLGTGIFIILPLIAGCAASSGIMPAGPDTYVVTERFAPIRGGSLTAQKIAMNESSAFCLNEGKEFLPLNMAVLPGISTPADTGYTVTFRCLNAGDPELQRPNYERAPDVVIENRNN